MAAGRLRSLGLRLRRAAALQWREFGWVGRTGLVGLVIAGLITVTLGFTIPWAARHHILEAQTDVMSLIAADIGAEGITPTTASSDADLARFDEEVRLRILGGETVRVKVWDRDGTIIYSDAAALRGAKFPLSEPALRAFAGEASHEVSDLEDPAHFLERDLGKLIEFYVPITDEDGTVIATFEIEQRVDALAATQSRIRRNVWSSIGLGLGILTLFMGSLTLTGARVISRRRRQAETLLTDLLRTRETERRSIAGALHGEIGQPLYRLLYGLEGSRAKTENPEVREELSRLTTIVREIDGVLRAQLRLLHHSTVEDVGLEPALEELVATTRIETGLRIELLYEASGIGLTQGSVLFWAAEEGLINVRKHALATRVAMRVSTEADDALLELVDDGRGIDEEDGLGLVTTRERLETIGGDLVVEAIPEGGTRFRARVPLEMSGS